MSMDQDNKANLTLVPGGLAQDQENSAEIEIADLNAEVVSGDEASMEEMRAAVESEIAQELELDLSATLAPVGFREETLSVSGDPFEQLASLAKGVEFQTSATPEEEMRLSMLHLSQVRTGLAEFMGNRISLTPDEDGIMRLTGAYQPNDYMIEGTGIKRPQDRELDLVALGAMRTADVLPIDSVKEAATGMALDDLSRGGFDGTQAATVTEGAVTADMMQKLATGARNYAMDKVRDLGRAAIDAVADDMTVTGDYRLN